MNKTDADDAFAPTKAVLQIQCVTIREDVVLDKHKGLPISLVTQETELTDQEEQDRDQDVMSKDSADDEDIEDQDSSSEDIDKSIPLSSLAWEAYELSSDWSKTLKGDHGILAALDLSLPLPMCNVDISSPTKPRDILDIFGDVMDLIPLNHFNDTRIDQSDPSDERSVFSHVACSAPGAADDSNVPDQSSGIQSTLTDVGLGCGNELDRSNTLMTPQELERMPDQGLEFEQSVGPKEPKSVAGENTAADAELINENSEMLSSSEQFNVATNTPIVLSHTGDELTTITVKTSLGEKIFKVNTAQLKHAASLMQPVIINTNDEGDTSQLPLTLVMLPVAKVKLIQPGQHASQGQTSGEERPKFRCLYCGKMFLRSYKLRLHEMMKHTLERPFPCSYPGCKWAFSDYYRQRNHERSHLKLKEHKCPICGKGYSSIWNLRAHIDQIHNDKNQCHKCSTCGAAFTAETKLHKHIAEQHPDLPKQYRCEEPGCGAEYHTKLGYMRHMLGHEKRKALNLVCPYKECGKEFKWKSRYNIHMRSHLGETQFKCSFQGCVAAFLTASGLNRHKKVHTEDKTFSCSICNKSFHRVDHLKAHERSHSEERPFVCRIPGCNHATVSRSALATHEKRHASKSNMTLFVCPEQLCKTTFSTKHLLIKHINAHHPNIVELQYSKELAAAGINLAGDVTELNLDKKLVEACATVECGQSRQLDWSDIQLAVVDTSSRHQPVTVINTEVAGKQVELILPADEPDVKKGSIPKAERGCARTDSSTNERMCAKARCRQQQQQSTTVVVPAKSHKLPDDEQDEIPSKISSQQFSNVNTPTDAVVVTLPDGSQTVVAVSHPIPQTNSSCNVNLSNTFEQWLSQDGTDSVATIICAADVFPGTSSDLTIAAPLDENTDFNQLYEALE